MRPHTKTFDTEAEARSFMESVSLANDSERSCHEPRSFGNQFVVYVHDWAFDSDTDVCPICGAGADLHEEVAP